jgi:hypothetical protein
MVRWHDRLRSRQPQVIAVKDKRLAGERPGAGGLRWTSILADGRPKALQLQGFSPFAKTV